jgi:hypothetical protein
MDGHNKTVALHHKKKGNISQSWVIIIIISIMIIMKSNKNVEDLTRLLCFECFHLYTEAGAEEASGST